MAAEKVVGSSTETVARKKPPARLIVIAIVATIGIASFVGYQRWVAGKPYEWTGTVEARTIDVGSRTGGRVKEVLVKEGDRVEARQPLVVLEPGDLEAQKLMAEAQLDQVQAALEKLENGSRPEEIAEAKARAGNAAASLAEAQHGARREEIDGAKARLDAAQATTDRAKLDADRAKQLFASGAISKSELDAATSNEISATAQRASAEASYNELKNGVRGEQITQAQQRAEEANASARLVESGARSEDVKAAQAMVKAAKGRLDQIVVNIDELTVRAARAARVEALDLRPGDLLAPSSTAAVLLEEDQLYVRIYVPETQIGHVHLGDEVPVFVDSFPNKPTKGVVEHIDIEGQYSPRNLQTADERANQVFAMRIGLRDGVGSLRAGMAAQIRVPK